MSAMKEILKRELTFRLTGVDQDALRAKYPDLDGHDEHHIIGLVKEGSLSAISWLYEAYFPLAYSEAAVRIRDHQTCEDVAQDSLVSAILHVDSFEYRGRLSLANWIGRIARNNAFSHQRKMHRIREDLIVGDVDSEPDDSEETYIGLSTPPRIWQPRDYEADPQVQLDLQEEELGRLRLIALVNNQIAKLSDAQRNVMTERFQSGSNIAETARNLGKKENNVKVIQHQAIKALRIRMASFQDSV